MGRIAVNAGLYLDVAVFQLQLAAEDAGVRAVADGDEHAGQFQFTGFIFRFGAADTHAGHAHFIAQHFVQRMVGVQHDVAAFHFSISRSIRIFSERKLSRRWIR